MDTQERFMPGLTTLGDILEENGYSQTLMIGSNARFGGRELYLQITVITILKIIIMR